MKKNIRLALLILVCLISVMAFNAFRKNINSHPFNEEKENISISMNDQSME